MNLGRKIWEKLLLAARARVDASEAPVPTDQEWGGVDAEQW